MNIWKTKDELAKYGRNGDTMIKKIDGAPAHVNAVEYEMSPEYIKEHGAGTINPITGLKEYALTPMDAAGNVIGKFGSKAGGFAMPSLDVIGLGLQGISMLMGGFSALENKKKVKDAKRGIGEDFNDQLRKLTEAKDREFQKIDTQYAMQTQQTNLQTGEALETMTQTAGEAGEKQGFEISDESIVDTGVLLDKYTTDTQNIVAGRKALQEESLFKRVEGMEQAEDKRDRMLAELEGVETSFIGGMFG